MGIKKFVVTVVSAAAAGAAVVAVAKFVKDRLAIMDEYETYESKHDEDDRFAED